jgi:hypothetical protein
MEFEPVILAGFEPRVQIDLNPFEPVASNRNGRIIVRHLTVMLMVYLKVNRARIGKPRFARSGSPLWGPAPSVSDRLKGGSK